jgi:hypothetical protein
MCNPEKEWCATAMLELSRALEQNRFTIVEKQGRHIGHRQYDGVEHRPKYTLQESGMKENKGWSQEGIARFNTLVEAVKEDRQDQGSEFDSIYLQY